MEINWSVIATKQLKKIHHYYSIKSNIRVANRIIEGIIKKVTKLKDNPLIGVRDELLKDNGYEFRFIVEGNYKIIYYVSSDSISISAVFDCRQNPQKITQISN